MRDYVMIGCAIVLSIGVSDLAVGYSRGPEDCDDLTGRKRSKCLFEAKRQSGAEPKERKTENENNSQSEVRVRQPSRPDAQSPGTSSAPGAAVNETRVTLNWSRVDGATEYDFGIRDTASNALVVDAKTPGTSYAARLERGKTYRWNVRACNSAGCSTFSAPLFFMTEGAVPFSGGQRAITELERRPDPRECVLYARARVPSLPYDLFTIGDKQGIINDNKPRPGSIAIINVPSGASAKYGHVAYVESVTSNSITISETNYSSGNFTKRQATGSSLADAESQLRIVGYFRP